MFAALDWQSRDFYVYVAIGGAVAAVLGLVLYALPGGRLSLPGWVVGVYPQPGSHGNRVAKDNVQRGGGKGVSDITLG